MQQYLRSADWVHGSAYVAFHIQEISASKKTCADIMLESVRNEMNLVVADNNASTSKQIRLRSNARSRFYDERIPRNLKIRSQFDGISVCAEGILAS